MKSPRLFLAMRFRDSASFFALERLEQKAVEERLMVQFMPQFPKALRDRWAHSFEFPLEVKVGKKLIVMEPGEGKYDTMTTENIYTFVESELPNLAQTVPGLELAPRSAKDAVKRRCHLANNIHAADCEFALLYGKAKEAWSVRDEKSEIEVDLVLKFGWGTDLE